jgi:alpha-beta hydrolase superfamily lysophospholipase
MTWLISHLGSNTLKPLAINFIFALFLQFCCLAPLSASVERNDLIPLGEELGFPVYEWKDNSKPPKAIIVGFHGMTFYGLALNDTATHFAAEGYPFYSFDFRGFGHWRDGSPKYKNDGKVHFSQSVEDGKTLIKALHEKYPDTKIYCMGESLGSNLIVWALSQETLPIDGAILCGLGIKTSLHPNPKWIWDFILGFTNPNRPLNLKPYIKTTLASSKDIVNVYLNDPKIHNKLCSRELVKALVTNKRSIEQSELIPEDVPLLIISGEKDRIFKIKSVENFAELVGTQQATCKVLPGRGHLLLELRPMDSDLASTIDTWIDNQIEIKQTKIPVKEEFKGEGAMNMKERDLRVL